MAARDIINETSRCCERVHGNRVCSRPAAAWRAGKPYCYTHDPDRQHMSMPGARDRRRRLRWVADSVGKIMSARHLIESALLEIASFDDSPSDEEIEQEVQQEWQQEQHWYQIAIAAKISDHETRAVAAEYGLTSPRDAIDAAEAGSGTDYPRRGSWSGELVWLFLALRKRGLIDANGHDLSGGSE